MIIRRFGGPFTVKDRVFKLMLKLRLRVRLRFNCAGREPAAAGRDRAIQPSVPEDAGTAHMFEPKVCLRTEDRYMQVEHDML